MRRIGYSGARVEVGNQQKALVGGTANRTGLVGSALGKKEGEGKGRRMVCRQRKK